MSKLIKSFILNMQFFMCIHYILIMMLKFFFLPTSKKRCEDEITQDPLPTVSAHGHQHHHPFTYFPTMIFVSHFLLKDPFSASLELLHPLLPLSYGYLHASSITEQQSISGDLQDCVLKPVLSKVGCASTFVQDGLRWHTDRASASMGSHNGIVNSFSICLQSFWFIQENVPVWCWSLFNTFLTLVIFFLKTEIRSQAHSLQYLSKSIGWNLIIGFCSHVAYVVVVQLLSHV